MTHTEIVRGGVAFEMKTGIRPTHVYLDGWTMRALAKEQCVVWPCEDAAMSVYGMTALEVKADKKHISFGVEVTPT